MYVHYYNSIQIKLLTCYLLYSLLATYTYVFIYIITFQEVNYVRMYVN